MISSNLPVSFKEQIEVTSASLDQINNSLFYSGQCSSTLIFYDHIAELVTQKQLLQICSL